MLLTERKTILLNAGRRFSIDFPRLENNINLTTSFEREGCNVFLQVSFKQ